MTGAPASLRVMFDSNAYDAILDHGDADRILELIAAGRLVVVTTRIQEDELHRIADTRRRNALLALHRQIGGSRVEPADMIASDTACLSGDALISGTAAATCDMLVTDDRELAAACPVAVSYAGFRERAGLSG